MELLGSDVCISGSGSVLIALNSISPTPVSRTALPHMICLLPCAVSGPSISSRWSPVRYVWQTDEPYETACSGCDTVCDGCSFEGPPLVPICTEELDHTVSEGATVTLEELRIDPVYWRGTNSSKDILACFFADACLGGLTTSALRGIQGHVSATNREEAWCFVLTLCDSQGRPRADCANGPGLACFGSSGAPLPFSSGSVRGVSRST